VGHVAREGLFTSTVDCLKRCILEIIFTFCMGCSNLLASQIIVMKSVENNVSFSVL